MRTATTLLEVMVAGAILATVTMLATTSLSSGISLQRTIDSRTRTDDDLNRVLQSLAQDLRNAKCNSVWISGSSATWSTTTGGTSSFSFRRASGFDSSSTSATSFSALTNYDQGIILTFGPSAIDSTKATLTKTLWKLDAAGAMVSQIGASQVLADNLALFDEKNQPGFTIVSVADTGTSVTGTAQANTRVTISACRNAAITNDGNRSLIHAATTVALRGTMFDEVGVTAPVITSTLTASGSKNADFRYDILASGYPTAYAAGSLPNGLTVSTATGIISGTPTVTGTFNVSLYAENSKGSDSKTMTLTLSGTIPVITSSLNVSALVNQSLSYAILATNNPTSYSVTGLPSGLSINSATGIISGVVTTVGSWVVTLSAINANGTGSASGTLSITSATPQPPVITSTTSATGIIGQAFTYSIVASNAPTSYSATGLPSGLTYNSGSGVISGTVANAWSGSIGLTATNAGGTGSASLALAIQTAIPVITSESKTATVGTSFTYQILGTNSPTTGSYVAGNTKPSWLSSPSNTGAMSGTPTTTGDYTISLAAANGTGTGYGTLTLHVDAMPVPVISTTGTASGTASSPFSYTITASNTPTSYGVSGAPSWLTCGSGNGVLGGTPTAAGSWNVTMSATNGSGTGTAALAITIATAATPPSISLGSNTGTGNGAAGFKVLGSITANPSYAVNYNSFTWSASQTGYSIQLGWVNAGNGSNALQPNEFRITGSKPSGSMTVTCSVSDVNAVQGTKTLTY